MEEGAKDSVAVMPVCKLSGPEVLPLSSSSMLHACSIATYILTELIAAWGGEGGQAGGSPLNARCQLLPELIAGLPLGQTFAQDSIVQMIRGKICMVKRLIKIFFFFIFALGCKCTQNQVTD